MDGEQSQGRVTDILSKAGSTDDPGAFERLLKLLVYVNGNYNEPATFT